MKTNGVDRKQNERTEERKKEKKREEHQESGSETLPGRKALFELKPKIECGYVIYGVDG